MEKGAKQMQQSLTLLQLVCESEGTAVKVTEREIRCLAQRYARFADCAPVALLDAKPQQQQQTNDHGA